MRKNKKSKKKSFVEIVKTEKILRSKIFYSEHEISKMVDEYETQIKEIKEFDLPSAKPYEVAVYERMIAAREVRIKNLQTQKLVLKSSRNKNTLDLKGLTFSEHKGVLIFLTARFNDSGFFYGFWTHSPCGLTRDQEQGYVVIDPVRLEIIETCESKTFGRHTGEIKSWRKDITEMYGKQTKLTDLSGEMVWKISDN